MAKKFHVNGEGNARECHARFNCPFGSVEDHYPTAADARKSYESFMEASISESGAFKKSNFQRPSDVIPAASRVIKNALGGGRISMGEALEDIAFKRLSK